jgi:hypothetical protein
VYGFRRSFILVLVTEIRKNTYFGISWAILGYSGLPVLIEDECLFADKRDNFARRTLT